MKSTLDSQRNYRKALGEIAESNVEFNCLSLGTSLLDAWDGIRRACESRSGIQNLRGRWKCSTRANVGMVIIRSVFPILIKSSRFTFSVQVNSLFTLSRFHLWNINQLLTFITLLIFGERWWGIKKYYKLRSRS